MKRLVAGISVMLAMAVGPAAAENVVVNTSDAYAYTALGYDSPETRVSLENGICAQLRYETEADYQVWTGTYLDYRYDPPHETNYTVMIPKRFAQKTDGECPDKAPSLARTMEAWAKMKYEEEKKKLAERVAENKERIERLRTFPKIWKKGTMRSQMFDLILFKPQRTHFSQEKGELVEYVELYEVEGYSYALMIFYDTSKQIKMYDGDRGDLLKIDMPSLKLAYVQYSLLFDHPWDRPPEKVAKNDPSVELPPKGEGKVKYAASKRAIYGFANDRLVSVMLPASGKMIDSNVRMLGAIFSKRDAKQLDDGTFEYLFGDGGPFVRDYGVRIYYDPEQGKGNIRIRHNGYYDKYTKPPPRKEKPRVHRTFYLGQTLYIENIGEKRYWFFICVKQIQCGAFIRQGPCDVSEWPKMKVLSYNQGDYGSVYTEEAWDTLANMQLVLLDPGEKDIIQNCLCSGGGRKKCRLAVYPVHLKDGMWEEVKRQLNARNIRWSYSEGK